MALKSATLTPKASKTAGIIKILGFCFRVVKNPRKETADFGVGLAVGSANSLESSSFLINLDFLKGNDLLVFRQCQRLIVINQGEHGATRLMMAFFSVTGAHPLSIISVLLPSVSAIAVNKG